MSYSLKNIQLFSEWVYDYKYNTNGIIGLSAAISNEWTLQYLVFRFDPSYRYHQANFVQLGDKLHNKMGGMVNILRKTKYQTINYQSSMVYHPW